MARELELHCTVTPSPVSQRRRTMLPVPHRLSVLQADDDYRQVTSCSLIHTSLWRSSTPVSHHAISPGYGSKEVWRDAGKVTVDAKPRSGPPPPAAISPKHDLSLSIHTFFGVGDSVIFGLFSLLVSLPEALHAATTWPGWCFDKLPMGLQ